MGSEAYWLWEPASLNKRNEKYKICKTVKRTKVNNDTPINT